MESKKRIECILASSAICMIATGASASSAELPSGAQEAVVTDAAPKAAVQDPSIVVVTANRVRTDAQKTAVALSVYSGNALTDAGVQNVQALQTIDPSINVTTATGAAYVAIRGVASSDVTEIGDPSVPIARDGFFTNRSFSIASSMYDVARVEVLKGPQGTLFGRNSTGGLINIITRRPTDTFGGYANFEVGNFNTINVESAVNVPLSDKVQLRASGITRRHDGYRNVTGVNIQGDDENVKSGRLQLAFQPIKGFEGLISYQRDKIDDVGDVTKQRPVKTTLPVGDARTFPGYAPVYTKLDDTRWRWEFSYDQLPYGLTLTYAGGYDKQEYRHALDISGSSYPASRNFRQAENPETQNHEIRLATDANAALTGQVGYFYFYEKNITDAGVFNLAMNADNHGADFSQTYGIRFAYQVKTRADGLFGQVGYKLNDQLKLTVGARYSRDEKRRNGQSVLNLGALVSPFISGILPPVIDNGYMKENKPTYQIGLDWSPTKTNFFYAKYATGYKSGGFNTNGTSDSIPYKEENLKSFEIGTKNRFDGRKYLFNAAAFYQKYSGYQASQLSDVLSSGAGVFNVGNATIRGVEAELNVNLENLARFGFNTTLLNTSFGDNIVITEGSSPPNNRSVSGNRLPNAPRAVLTASIERDFDVPGGVLTPRLFAKYSSDFYYTVFNDPDTRSPGTTTANFLLSYKPTAGSWETQLFVNNLTDKVVLANSQRNYVSNVNTLQFQPPRTFGARVRYNF